MAVGTSPRSAIDPLAVLSSPAEDDTMIIAPYTCWFSGLDSTPGNAPIVRYEWDFGDSGSADPQTDDGEIVAHRFDNAGTYNVTLTVTDNDARTHSVVLQVVVAAFAGLDRYVDFTNGNDSWDGTSGAFVSGTIGPWKTLEHATLQVALLGSRNNPNRLYLRKDETWVFTSGQLSSGAPMIIDAYALAAEVNDPIVEFQNVDGVWEFNAPGGSLDFGYGVIMQNVEVKHTTAHAVNRVLLPWASGSVIRDCKITNSGSYVDRGGALHRHITWEDCVIRDGHEHCIFTNGVKELTIRRNTLQGNGTNSLLDHFVYFSHTDKILLQDNTMDGSTSPELNVGIKIRIVNQMRLSGNDVSGSRYAGSIGGNPDNGDVGQSSRIIVENNKLHDFGAGNESGGFFVDLVDDCIIRNNLFYSIDKTATGIGLACIMLTLDPDAVDNLTVDTLRMRIYNNTFHDIGIHCLYIAYQEDDPWEADFINNIIELQSGVEAGKAFVRTERIFGTTTDPDLSNLRMDYNHFYHPSLTGVGDNTFALLSNSANTSFTQWKNLAHSPDANSQFGVDPLISSPPPDTNMKPAGGSAAIDNGRKAHQWVDKDYAGNTRHLGNKWDIGAHEQ